MRRPALPTSIGRTRAALTAVAALGLTAAACGSSASTGGGSSSGSGGYGGSAPSRAPAAAATGAAPTVSVAKTGLGDTLVDGQGRVLYLFEKDTGAASTCAGSCAGVWPPYAGPAPHAGAGATAALVGSFARPDGSQQVSYNGHPLYYYVGDAKPGDTRGEGLNQFGAKWYVLGASGAKIDKD